jgi:hypothetical protein
MKRPMQVNKFPAGYDALMKYVHDRNAKPISRATRKLHDFVGACVTDPDFKHEQSTELLRFLIIIRDELTDQINEHWTLDDILEPVAAAIRSHAGKAAQGKPKPNRKTPLRAGLELLVKKGMDNEQIIDLLGNADEISSRARDGFPFEVHDPRTTLRDDGVLSHYKTGSDAEKATQTSIKDIRKLLSRIRRSPKAA